MLDAFIKLVTPCNREIIAVHTCGTDKRSGILESFRGHLPLQIFDQSRRGKRAALNMDVEHAGNDLMIFAGDAVIPARDWLVCFPES